MVVSRGRRRLWLGVVLFCFDTDTVLGRASRYFGMLFIEEFAGNYVFPHTSSVASALTMWSSLAFQKASEGKDEDMYLPAVVSIKRLWVRAPGANGDPVVEALQQARSVLKSSQSLLASERADPGAKDFSRNAQPTHVKTPARASLDMLRNSERDF
jgi:hypothetical protein